VSWDDTSITGALADATPAIAIVTPAAPATGSAAQEGVRFLELFLACAMVEISSFRLHAIFHVLLAMRSRCSPEELWISRVGRLVLRARCRLIPTHTRSGIGDPTSQGWPMASASLPEGPGFDD
jgi:hypothetical protein